MRGIKIILMLVVTGIWLASCGGLSSEENISKQDENPYEDLIEEMGEVRTEKEEDIYVHVYRGNYRSYEVNTYIIEGRRKLVVIDTQHFLSRAQEVRSFVDYLDKPVERVIISHSHQDHYMGIEEFKDLPIYATQETIENMKGEAEELRQRRIAKGEPYLGEYPEQILYPENILEESFTIDGVDYEVIKIEDTQDRDGMIIKIPRISSVFVGDLVERDVHLAVLDPESYIDALKMLQTLEEEGYRYILPGHGEIYGFGVIEENLEYLYSVREILREELTAREYKRRIEEEYPDYGGADYVVGLMVEGGDIFLPEEE